jgi:hypothetical protein
MNERCDTLQPILDKKIDFAAQYYNSSIASESADIQGQYLLGYLDQVDKTIKFSMPWLDRARNMVNTSNFKYFVDPLIKEKIYALLDKFYADYLGNVAIQNFYTNPSESTAANLKTSLNYMDEEQKALEKKVKAAAGYSDIRGRFIKVEDTKCNLIKQDSPGVPVNNPNQAG